MAMRPYNRRLNLKMPTRSTVSPSRSHTTQYRQILALSSWFELHMNYGQIQEGIGHGQGNSAKSR
jgi:hypothetical protein